MIDIVYTWVDGSDPLHQERLAKATGVNREYRRFGNHQEIYYSVYSIHKFAPWVRTIFIVCADYQRPNLQGLPEAVLNKIIYIKHSDIMPQEALPTFSSIAIETCLHRIPDLSEQFIYFNDDTFLGNHVRPEDFFPTPESGFFFQGRAPMPLFQPCRWIEPWLNILLTTLKVYHQVTGKPMPWPFWRGLHQCHPCQKSILKALWENPIAQAELNKSLHKPLRCNYTVNIVPLMYLVGRALGRVIPKTLQAKDHFCIHLRYFDGIFPWRVNLFRKIKPKLLCLSYGAKHADPRVEKVLSEALYQYFDHLLPPKEAYLRNVSSLAN